MLERDVVGVALDGDLGVGATGIDATIAARRSGGTRVGVPPPTNTVEAAGIPPSTARAISVRTASRYAVDEMVAVGPRRERAVVALRCTERDVDVHPERLDISHPGNLQASIRESVTRSADRLGRATVNSVH